MAVGSKQGPQKQGPQKQGPQKQAPQGDEVDFGFLRVARSEKPRLVRDVFDDVASNYDLMNDLMSLGVHRLWKRVFLDWIDPRPTQHLLDVAGGTGDITFGWKARGGGPVTVVDYSHEMLAQGRDRAIDRGLFEGIDWVHGDAQALPIRSDSIDTYTISFGLRNVTDIDAALREAARVLQPGGRFFCLEFSHVVLPGLDRIYDAYSFSLLPRIGAVVARNRDAYQYLVESIRRFPDQEELLDRMAAAGLSLGRARNLSGGIAAVHSARKI